MTTPHHERPTFMDRVREAPMLLKIGLPIVLVVFIVTAASGGNRKSGDTSGHTSRNEPTGSSAKVEAGSEPKRSSNVSSQPDPSQQSLPEQPAPKPSPDERLREALGDSVSSGVAVGDSEVRSVKVTGQLVAIILSTPGGGFEGPSTDDTDGLASAALAKVYGEGDWRGAAFVEFRGGLVNSATGRPLPNAPTVSYRVERREARRIDWSDEEDLYNIDWSIYRGCDTYAIKGCE